MMRKIFEDLNCERFLTEAFEEQCQDGLIRAARLRRNVYMVLFLVGFCCILTAGIMGMWILSVLSLFLSTLSLVVMSKYDTQLYFLKLISKKMASEKA